ncbi:MAG TPA: NYN domain-containing protein [Azospirillaceae bacterium]|nr:NYN domain-containing protein [Azospirillaceae bacterium]
MDYRSAAQGMPNAAVFVDVENMAFAQSPVSFQVDRLMQHILREANPIVRRAYADWRSVGPHVDAFNEHAFDQLQVTPANGQKNAADILLSVDALDIVLTSPQIQRVYLVSGDSDFCPLVRSLRRRGREVVGISWSGALGELLRAHCDRIVFYEHLAGIPMRGTAGFEAPAHRAPVQVRRPVIRRPIVEVDADEQVDPVLERFVDEVGVVENMPEEAARTRLLRMDTGTGLPSGPALRAWLSSHPRIRVDVEGDEAFVTVVPPGETADAQSGPEAELNAAISAENLVFLGARVQRVVLDALFELLAARTEPFTRSEALQHLRYRLRDLMPETDFEFDSLNSIFHIFYRAHAFQRFAGMGVRNAPLLLKPQYKDAQAFRDLHDRYLIQLATRQGLSWSAEAWADVLHGNRDRLGFVEGVLASLMPAGFGEGGGGDQPYPSAAQAGSGDGRD